MPIQIRRCVGSPGVRRMQELDASGRDVPLIPDSVIITAEATKPESPRVSELFVGKLSALLPLKTGWPIVKPRA